MKSQAENKYNRVFAAVILLAVCLCCALCFIACEDGGPHVHEYAVVGTVEPTCTVKGKKLFKCTCGDSYEEDYKAAKGHKYDKGTYIEATCAADGGKKIRCTVCGDSYLEQGTVIPALEHSYVFSKTVAPKCKEQGYDLYICGGCSKIMQTNFTVELGHTIVADEGRAATCSSEGVTDGSHCSVCNTVLQGQKVLPMIEHKDDDLTGYCDDCSVFIRELHDIYTISDLKQVVNDMAANYVLRADLVLDEAWNGLGDTKDLSFTGTFFGNGHKIRGLNLSVAPRERKGLFACNRGVIDGLTLENITMSAQPTDFVDYTNYYCGGIACYNYGTISNCKITGHSKFSVENKWTMPAEYETEYLFVVGGIAAVNSGVIENCAVEGSAETDFLAQCTFRQTGFLTTSSDWAKIKSTIYFGAVAGKNEKNIIGTVVDCILNLNLTAAAKLTSYGKAYANMIAYTGAMVGENSGTINDCKGRSYFYNPQKTAEQGCTADIFLYKDKAYSGLIASNRGKLNDLEVLS